MADPENDLWGGELGAFEVEVDDSAAIARAERIAAAREAGKGYTAKFDEPGWYNDPAQAARAKGAARPALFALHQAYLEARFDDVVDAARELLGQGVKEETEVLDLGMRAALRCGRGRDDDVVQMAKRWKEWPNLPSHSLTSARILALSSPLCPPSSASSSPTSTPTPSSPAPIPSCEVLSAALASLRLHPSLPLPRAFLRSLLSGPHPALAAALAEPARAPAPAPVPASAADPPPQAEPDAEQPAAEAEALEAEIHRIDVPDAERDILRRVLGLDESSAGEDELEGVGKDVRSL